MIPIMVKIMVEYVTINKKIIEKLCFWKKFEFFLIGTVSFLSMFLLNIMRKHCMF